MPNPRVGHALFCDDIRMEVGNKPSFMGCYSGEMNVPASFPAFLPKFGIAAWLICDVDDPPTFFKATVVLSDGKDFFSIEGSVGLPKQLPPDTKKLNFSTLIPLAPLPVPCEGNLEVWIETELGKIRAGRLRINSAPQQVGRA
jgi:hypothetical protein